MSVAEAAHNLLAPIFQGRGLDIYDLTYGGGVLRIIVDKPGGVLLDEVADVSKVVSRLLDDHEICSGRYTLEVTSPGLERPLRSPEHFAKAVGETINVKLGPHVDSERRIEGVLLSCTQDSISVAQNGVTHHLLFDDIAKAKTKFEWGPTSKKTSVRSKSLGANTAVHTRDVDPTNTSVDTKMKETSSQ